MGHQVQQQYYYYYYKCCFLCFAMIIKKRLQQQSQFTINQTGMRNSLIVTIIRDSNITSVI